ncbi:MAG: hypothetical protein AB1757_00935 [Acidobacteriota bacterium]
MKKSLIQGILSLICYGLITCQNQPKQNVITTNENQPQLQKQEIVLSQIPAPDLTDNDFTWAWVKVSKNNKRYKPIRLDEFKISGLRRFQCHQLGECYIIVADQKVKDASRYKILVLYARDYSYKHRDYKPYWVTCNYDLTRTSLWNSNIGVVAIEYLGTGGHRVSILKWDEEKKTFTCVEVGSFSLVFPAE